MPEEQFNGQSGNRSYHQAFADELKQNPELREYLEHKCNHGIKPLEVYDEWLGIVGMCEADGSNPDDVIKARIAAARKSAVALRSHRANVPEGPEGCGGP